MNTKTTFTFEKFCQANPDKNVTGYDFLRVVYKSMGLPGDFLLWFVTLIWPDFSEIDGKIYVADLFDRERYEKLRKSGQTSAQAQFWMNLLEITGLFDELPDDQVRSLAKKIAEGWTAKIRRDFGAAQEGARVIEDDDSGEIFVVIGHPD